VSKRHRHARRHTATLPPLPDLTARPDAEGHVGGGWYAQDADPADPWVTFRCEDCNRRELMRLSQVDALRASGVPPCPCGAA
jgi:hypothetical protein